MTSNRLTNTELEERLVAQGQRIRDLEERDARKAREIERLKANSPSIQAKTPQDDERGLPKGAELDSFGFVTILGHRVGHMVGGKFVPFEEVKPDDVRQQERLEKTQAEENVKWGAATAGLPVGLYRDPCGLVRDSRTGKIFSLPAIERQRAELAAVDEGLAEQQRFLKDEIRDA